MYVCICVYILSTFKFEISHFNFSVLQYVHPLTILHMIPSSTTKKTDTKVVDDGEVMRDKSTMSIGEVSFFACLRSYPNCAFTGLKQTELM